VNQVRRLGNGYLGRAATRWRMRSRDLGYVGSERVLGGRAKRHVAPRVLVGKAWR
jgi:hypothetical protein